MSIKTFLSRLTGLLKTDTPIPETVEKKAPPKPKKEKIEKEPGTPPPPRKKEPGNKPTKKQEKQEKKPVKQKKKIDKKGIRIIKDDDDLEVLFLGEKSKKKQEDEFARLFEQSQSDVYQQSMMKEKHVTKDFRTPISPTEKLKSYPAPQAELDLHGCTGPEAVERTETFIRNAKRQKLRTIRIIVGKGTHSEGKAILPDVTEQKVIELKRNGQILNYKWENKDKRKSGSIIVFL